MEGSHLMSQGLSRAAESGSTEVGDSPTKRKPQSRCLQDPGDWVASLWPEMRSWRLSAVSKALKQSILPTPKSCFLVLTVFGVTVLLFYVKYRVLIS